MSANYPVNAVVFLQESAQNSVSHEEPPYNIKPMAMLFPLTFWNNELSVRIQLFDERMHYIMTVKRSFSFLSSFLVIVSFVSLIESQHTTFAYADSPNATQNQSCSQGPRSFLKGVVPGAPVDKQGHIAITADAAFMLANSCAQTIRLDLITQPFYHLVHNQATFLGMRRWGCWEQP